MKRLGLVALLILIGAMASCANDTAAPGGAGKAPQPPPASPTAAPLTLAAITTLTIPGNDIYEPVPTSDGFIFVKRQKTPGSFVGTLYHYVVATKQLTVLDTAVPDADGNNRDIRLPTVAGDTVAYIKSTNDLTAWEFWILNLKTRQKTLLDSYHQTNTVNEPYPSNFAMDADHIVWSTLTTQNGHQGSFMLVYTLADHSRKTILTDFTSTPPTIFRPALQGSTITYTKLPFGATLSTSESVWRVALDGTNNHQIAPTATANVNITMSDAYVAWDELTNEDKHDIIRAFDLATNQEVSLPYNTCVRPTLYHQFLACTNLNSAGAYIIDLQTGRWANFGQGQSITNISMTQDRIFWSNTDAFDAEWMAYPS